MDYPVNSMLYKKIIGKTRVINLASIFQDLGFSVSFGPVEANDVDLLLYKDDILVSVFEITNYRFLSYLSIGNLNRYFTNLRKYDVVRILVISFIDNLEDNLNYVRRNEDIKIIEVGFQTIPDEYWYFFYIRNKLGDKKTVTESYEIVKDILISFLTEVDLI